MQQLEIGDFVLSQDVIVERKTVADFLQSLIDGRLFTQLEKISSYPSPLIILEGKKDDLFTTRAINENAIKAALMSITLNFRVPIIFTNDEEETADYLFLIAKREQLDRQKEISLRVGRKGLTLPEQQQFIVEGFPLIGPNTAKKLLKHFKSIKNIVNASDAELQEVDKMGPKKAKQIKEILEEEFKEEE